MNRLNDDDYQKPAQTFSDRLTKHDIKQMLEDFKPVKPEEIKLGSTIRYFSYEKTPDDGTLKFRMGGIAVNIQGLPVYLVLSNGSKSWSVQTKNTIFYEKMQNDELKAEFRRELLKKDNEIKILLKQNKEILEELNELKTKKSVNKKK